MIQKTWATLLFIQENALNILVCKFSSGTIALNAVYV